MCKEFYYRIEDNNINFFAIFNTCKENILRNNDGIKLYKGEWVKIKINNYQTHIVKPTETLEIIAEIYNVDKDKIIKDNELKSNKLFIGQNLKIFT